MSNGINGSCKSGENQSLIWELGIINGAGKFLTAETFGFKLSVSATSMKKKQLWTIVPHSSEECFYVVSHLKRYLSSDKDGKVSCEVEEKSDEEKFAIEFCPAGSGKWAFKSVPYGYYLSGSEDRISCFSKSPVWWSVKLAIHPQVHMQNQKRQRYVRLQNDELQGDQIIPWGYDSLITLQHDQSGKVAVCSRDNKYLMKDGGLTDTLNDDSLFGLEIRGGASPGFAFKDKDGKYLTLIGSNGGLKTKNKTVGKDELFNLEVSYPQVGLRAHNGKFASIKQGVDLYANQTDAGETETFQFEFDTPSKTWKLRCSNGKYWTVAEVNNGIKASGSGKDVNCLFQLNHLPGGKVSLKAQKGLFVTSRKLGLMSALGETEADESLFDTVLLNRPTIIFKSEFGLVGTRNGRVDCSMSNYEPFCLESVLGGKYYLKSCSNNKELYWTLGSDGQIRMEPAKEPENMEAHEFILQFHSGTHCTIIAAKNGRYLHGEQNGPIKADAEEVDKTALWEF